MEPEKMKLRIGDSRGGVRAYALETLRKPESRIANPESRHRDADEQT